MNFPGHVLESPEPLRDVPGQRRVYRTRYAGQACVTRVLLSERLHPRFAPMLLPIVRDGRGSLPGVPEAIALTLEGYRVAARLPATDPPSWPRALTAGLTAEGYVYITTTWIPGIPLHEVRGPLAEPEQVALDVLRALATFHRQHVVYGDLKPANVVLGPEGRAALIDLDTLREVGGADIAAPSRDLTRTWAAPEQEGGNTWLSSDLWAFARLVGELFPGGLPPGWAAPLATCRNPDPTARPRTDLLLLALEGTTLSLRDWADRPLLLPPDAADAAPTAPGGATAPGPALPGSATERVPEAPGATERVVESAGATERVPEAPGAARPPSLPPAGPGRTASLGGTKLTGSGCVTWVAGLFLLLVALCTGAWGWWEHNATVDADHHADEAMAALKAYKTRADLNRDEANRGRCRALADEAADIHATPRALGVQALARVWEAGLQDTDATWDGARAAELEALVSTALATGDPAASLAWATLEGARCRLDHGSTEAAVACERALAALGDFDESLPAEEDWNWLRVEAAWTEVLVRGAVAHAAEVAHLPDAATRRAEVQARCAEVEPLLPWAPVNGPELVQDCLHHAGTSDDLDHYFHWARWLVDHDLGDRSLSKTTLRHLYQAAGPTCDTVTVSEKRGEWVIKGGEPWCLAVGHAARGCLDLSREVMARAAPDETTHPWDTLSRTIAALPGDCAR